MKKWKKVLFTLVAVTAALVIACGIYAGDYYRAEDTAVDCMETAALEITNDGAVFVPENPEAGLIFYPGGKVEFAAYAPLMEILAKQDILCVLLKMPLNLAVLDMDAAEGIPERFPKVDRWYLGGHSLGGSMAASFAGAHADVYEGLILLAAYSTEDLSKTGLKVCSLYGDRDGVLDKDKYQKYRDNLPAGTLEQVLTGGNHAGFGSYGHQSGDGETALQSGMQMQLTADILTDFILD